MMSPPLRFRQPCGRKKDKRAMAARRAGAAVSHLIRMRHLFTTEVIKPTELLIIFQKIAKLNLFD